MISKYKLARFLLVLCVISNGLLASNKLPEDFFINYELFQFIKLRNVDIEKTQILSGEINLKFKSKSKSKSKIYNINIQLLTKKFLKLYGDKTLKSEGLITKKGLLFETFQVKDLKKPKKNILVVFDRKKDNLKV